MIVDLIRNDLGRIAEIGSVAVPDLFAVETYPTLHTMVSTVTAKLRPARDHRRHRLRRCFPAARSPARPRSAAMEILRELESSPRGAYCGAIGFFAPDGGAPFQCRDPYTDDFEMNAARWASAAAWCRIREEASEYAECLLKARFFEAPRRPWT